MSYGGTVALSTPFRVYTSSTSLSKPVYVFDKHFLNLIVVKSGSVTELRL